MFRTLGFLRNQMVVPGRNRQGACYVDPVRYQLINLVMISNIDWNDFTLSNDEFERNSVLEIDRDAVQAV